MIHKVLVLIPLCNAGLKKMQEWDRKAYAKRMNEKHMKFVGIGVWMNYRRDTENQIMRFEWMFFFHGFPIK